MILYQRWLLMDLILGAAEAARMSSILARVCSNSAVSLGVCWSKYRLSVASETACAHQVKNVGVMGPLGSDTVLVAVNPAAPENRNICFPPAGQSPQARLRVYGSIGMRRSLFPHPLETISYSSTLKKQSFSAEFTVTSTVMDASRSLASRRAVLCLSMAWALPAQSALLVAAL